MGDSREDENERCRESEHTQSVVPQNAVHISNLSGARLYSIDFCGYTHHISADQRIFFVLWTLYANRPFFSFQFFFYLSLPGGPAASGAVIGVVGDFGSGTSNELAVANLIKSWNPDFIMTVGDNNYPYGQAATIDGNVGQFYHDYIYPYP